MKYLLIIFILISVNLKAGDPFKFPAFKLDDKAKHFYVAMSASIVAGEILYQTTDLEGLSSAIGTALGISITVAKEYVYDRYLKHGVFSIDDMIVGIFGAITGGIVHRVIIDLRYKHNQKEIIKLRNAKELLN